MPERLRAGILVGAFAGMRDAEACGLRVPEDIDFMRGVIHPRVQYPAQELKTETSRTPVPISRSLALDLSAHVASWPGEWLLTNDRGGQLGPWQLQRAMRGARAKVPGLPAGFRYQDLRHYLASLLIASGADVKTVQARLRHASATTPTAICGPTRMSPPGRPSTRSCGIVRTYCGLRLARGDFTAGQPGCRAQTS